MKVVLAVGTFEDLEALLISAVALGVVFARGLDTELAVFIRDTRTEQSDQSNANETGCSQHDDLPGGWLCPLPRAAVVPMSEAKPRADMPDMESQASHGQLFSLLQRSPARL